MPLCTVRASRSTLGQKGKLSKCALKGSKHALNFFRVALPHRVTCIRALQPGIFSKNCQEYHMIPKSGTIHWIASGCGHGMWAQQEQPLQENGCKTYKRLTLKCPNQQNVLGTMDFCQFTVFQIFLSIFLSIFVNYQFK